MELPLEFKTRMKAMLGDEYEAFISGYGFPAVRGLRVNTLKLTKECFLELSPWRTEQAETLFEGLILTGEAEHIGTHPYHIAGLFYMQEPSAMSVIAEAEIEPGMKVLDLCAAPGGKSGGIAARLEGKGLIVSNEIVPSRARELASNLERLGVVNAAVTCARPDAVADALPGYFDRVIVDAPCSGEGMFRRDPGAIAEWSPEHVASCAARQSAIMESASKLVTPGGKLIYSTCTFSPEENEGVIESFLAEHPEFSPEITKRLYPHRMKGEGHFVARLVRSKDGTDRVEKTGKRGRGASKPAGMGPADAASKTLALELFSALITEPERPLASLLKNGDRLIYCPFDSPEGLNLLPIVSMGTEVGTLSSGYKKSFVLPSHSFFMAAHGFEYLNTVDLDVVSPELKRFLGGDTLAIPESLSGFVPVTVGGFPVGFGKAVGGVLKNRLPKGLTVPGLR